MEAEKLERLHSTLMKLAPKGKVGGLGYASHSTRKVGRDETLPNNALYNNFVRAGSTLGQYHKKKFDECDKSNDDYVDDANMREKKRKGERKKEKKEKKHRKREDTVEASLEADSHFEEDDIGQEKSKKKKRKKSKRNENVEVGDMIETSCVTDNEGKGEEEHNGGDKLRNCMKRRKDRRKVAEERGLREEAVEKGENSKTEKKKKKKERKAVS